MKQLSFLFLFPFFLFFIINEKPISQSEKTSQINQPCKIKKVFYNDILSQEYHYNSEKKLIRIDHFIDGKTKYFFSLNYDEQDRISFSEYGFYFHYSDEYVEENEIETNPVITQLNRYTYLYDETHNSQINTMKVYYGKATKETTVEENLKYTNRYVCSYNSKNQLVKFENIHKKRRKKKLKNTGWYELEYDNNNPIRIKNYFLREGKDTILNSVVEREYDSNPNLQFYGFDFINYPALILKNNLTYSKTLRRTKGNFQLVQEEKFAYEYDENGLLIQTSKSVIYPKSDDKKNNVFTYKYVCE